MQRRIFLQSGLAAAVAGPLSAAVRDDRFEAAAEILARSVQSGPAETRVAAAVLLVEKKGVATVRRFGSAASDDAMFLLGSISKPIATAALAAQIDRGLVRSDDRVRKYLPDYQGDGRERTTVGQLLTHVSGLPDQLPENDELRRSHAPLSEFVGRAVRTPLLFAPGSKYGYSSMGILLATRVAEIVSGLEVRELIERTVFRPLGMQRSAQGLGAFRADEFVPVQTEQAAPESGGGDPTARDWDWNSRYWRGLGAPWGGTHASAADVGRFLGELLNERGAVLKPETARRMTANQNPDGFTPRGWGFGVGAASGSPGCSDRTFGHTGSTGTLAWADPASGTICVVLTSLPARAVRPHPRDSAAAAIVG